MFGACGGKVHGLTPYVRKCPRDWKLTLTGCSVLDTVLYALYLLTYLILNIRKVAQRRVWSKEEAVWAQAGKYLARAYTSHSLGPSWDMTICHLHTQPTLSLLDSVIVCRQQK